MSFMQPGRAMTVGLVLLGVVALVPGAAQARRSCGNMTVQGGIKPIHTEIDVLKGRVSCSRARAVTAYAWSPRHRSRQGNKFLGDPRGWTCVVARATQPAVAGTCVRNADGAVVRAFNLDYGE